MSSYTKINTKPGLLNIVYFSFVYLILLAFILYLYNFQLNFNTLLFVFLVPLIILPFFLSKDLLHPFIIFFATTQFLFIFNMIDVHVNKSSFRYGNLPANYHDTAFTWSIIVIITWYVFMYLGYVFSKKTKTKPSTSSLFKIHNTKYIALILISVGLISYLVIFFSQGGIEGIIEGLSARVETYAGLSYYMKLTGVITIGALMLLENGYKKTSMIVIVMTFLMLASFGGRGAAFFGSIFPYLIFYHYRIKKFNIMKLGSLALVVILFVIGFGNYRLNDKIGLNLTNPYELLSEVSGGVQGGEILPSLIGSLLSGNIDYQYGSTLINVLFAPIPSSIWPNKPPVDETGIVGQALMGSEYWGLPPGPYGIAFFNFGFIGVIIIAFIVGIIIYKLYYKFIIHQSSNNIGLMFYTLIIVSVFNFISTSAQIDIIWYLLIFVFIKLLDVFISYMYVRKM